LATLIRQHLEQTGEAAKARQSGITDARIMALAREVAEDIKDPEQAFRELEAAVADAVEYRASIAAGSNADQLVADLRRRLDALANEGRLSDAQAEATHALAAFEAREAARRERADETLRQLLDTTIRQHLAVRDAAAAA
jgi:hypothetical protein